MFKAIQYQALRSIALLIAVSVMTPAQQLTYPQARRGEQVDIYHGTQVADPYRWMENSKDAEVADWIKAQEDLLQRFVRRVPARDAIEKRISELVTYDSYTNAGSLVTPYVSKRGSRYFFIKTQAGRSEPVLYAQAGRNAAPEVLIDVSANSKGEKIGLIGYEPSPNGQRVALFLSQAGSRWLTLKVLDVATRKELADLITDAHTLGGNVSWAANGQGFFYTKFAKRESDAGSAPTPVNPKIYLHQLGQAQSDDRLMYEQSDDQNSLFTHQVTADGRHLVLTTLEGSNPNNRVFYKDLQKPNAPVTPLFENVVASYTFLGGQGTRFWFYTDREAPRGRVIVVDVTRSEAWQEVVGQSAEAISAGSTVGGNALGMFGNRLVLMYMKDSNPRLRIFDLRGRLQHEVQLPSGGTIWGGLSGTQNDDEVFYQFLSLTSPGLFYRLDLRSRQNQVFLRPQVKLNPNDYETKQVFYQSKDGTRVPMFIAHRKGLKLDGNNPAYMYGYGAMSWVAFLFYQPHVITWLDMGGVYAIPGIRGGGEYGEDWHQAGVKQKKQNAVDDYIAATQWLIQNRYTSAAKFVANGGSASSAVVAAAAITQHPELYGAAVLDIPVFDMLRYHLFTNGRYWLSEFGSPDNAEEFKALLAFSPYHNLKDGQCYPPTIINVGERDTVALPLHAYKFTARLQRAQGCANPVLLKTMRGAGHNFGATPEQRINSWTDQLTFLVDVLKLNPSPKI